MVECIKCDECGGGGGGGVEEGTEVVEGSGRVN